MQQYSNMNRENASKNDYSVPIMPRKSLLSANRANDNIILTSQYHVTLHVTDDVRFCDGPKMLISINHKAMY